LTYRDARRRFPDLFQFLSQGSNRELEQRKGVDGLIGGAKQVTWPDAGIAPRYLPCHAATMPPSQLTNAQEVSISDAIAQLLAAPDEPARYSILQRNPKFQDRAVVLQLATDVPRLARNDVERATRSAELAAWLAEILDDDFCRARSARAMGHPLQLQGKLRESLEQYQRALDLFTKLKLDSELAITLSGSLQPLILLGDYKESRAREEKARKIFSALGDALRLARLDANLGNILHRQDRFEEALVLYRRAEQALQRFGAKDDLALALNNIAICHISLREFDHALEAYVRLRAYSEELRLPRLSVQADYNIAYVHYLRGAYDRAIELYDKTRLVSVQTGDQYHAALCDLDQSEIYLHMNLPAQSATRASQALNQFQRLKMNYEAAKAYTFLGLASCYHFDGPGPLDLFGKARELFVLEQNWIWPPLIDLYRGIVLYGQGLHEQALKAVTAAQTVLSHSALKEKAALAELLRALLNLDLADKTAASYWAECATERIERSKLLELRYLAAFVLGCVRERQGQSRAAEQYYEKARKALDRSPSPRFSGVLKPPLVNSPASLSQHLLSLALLLPGPGVTEHPQGS
jgi:tetratricopeptide (TPR) repeat protein